MNRLRCCDGIAMKGNSDWHNCNNLRGEAWEEIKLGMEQAWAHITQAFANARARMDESKAA